MRLLLIFFLLLLYLLDLFWGGGGGVSYVFACSFSRVCCLIGRGLCDVSMVDYCICGWCDIIYGCCDVRGE